MHLMRRQQLSPKIFWDSSLSDISAILIRSNRIFGIVTLADKPSLRASARQAEEGEPSSEKTVLKNRKVGFGHNSSKEYAEDGNIIGQTKPRS